MKAGLLLEGVRRGLGQGDQGWLDERNETEMRLWGPGRWWPGPRALLAAWARRSPSSLLKGKKNTCHPKTGVSQFMNAGFCNSKCRLMHFLRVILFVRVVVVLKRAQS